MDLHVDLRKTLAAGGLLLAVSASLTACGGGSSSQASAGDAAGAPSDAAKADFCGTLEGTGTATKPSAVAASLAAVGTPSDIDTSSRHGFEVLVAKMAQISSSNPSDSDIAKIAQDFKAADLADVQAFIAYYVKECAGGLLPSAGAS
jgi:hypothetical protein